MIRSIATWSAAAAVSALAAIHVARHPTPIDGALPFICIAITIVAAFTRPAVLLAVPLLIIGEIALPDEKQRLLFFGVVVAIAMGGGVLSVAPAASPALRRFQAHAIATASILLLRWIPFSEVSIGRELLLLLLANAVVLTLNATPIAIAVAVFTALFTPLYPLRTIGIALAVLFIAAVARFAGAGNVRMPAFAATAMAVMLLFFPWSGAFVRALPIVLRGGPPELQRVPVQISLAAGQSAEVDVPPNGRGLILSGANVPRMRKGTAMGWVTPGNVTVRIGDIADWGVLRREHHFNSRNPLPRRPGGLVRGYGYTSWIDASGRVPVRPGRIVVTADRNLPPRAMLQIDAIELGE